MKNKTGFVALVFLLSSVFTGLGQSNGYAKAMGDNGSETGSYTCPIAPKVAAARVVDDRFLLQLQQETSKLQGGGSEIVVDPSIAWLPHSSKLILSWRGGTSSSSGSQIIATIDRDGTGCRILGQGFAPLPSPDGKHIAYFSLASGSVQLYSMDSDGSHQLRLTDVPFGLLGWANIIPSFAWSPDSRAIAYATNKQQSMATFNDALLAARARAANNPEIAHVTVFRSDSPSSGLATPGGEIWIVSSGGASSRRVLVDSNADITALVWGPDRDTILFTAYRFFSAQTDLSSIKRLTISSGQVHTLLQLTGIQQELQPVLAHSGKALLYAADPVFRQFGVVYDLAIMPIDGGSSHFLTNDFKVGSYVQWSERDRWVYFTSHKNSVYVRLYRVRQGGVPQLVSREPERISSLSGYAFAVSSDGRSVAWLGQDALDHLRLRIARGDGSHVRTLIDLHPIANELKVSMPEEFHYRSADGLELAALLIKPLNYKPGHRYPLIADVHGGGLGSSMTLDGEITYGTGPLEWQLWAAKGYAEIITDYGSSGDYGRAPVEEIRKNHDVYSQDCKDVLGAVDYAIAHGIADPNRLGIIGHSNGATHTNFMITHTHRFRAAISYEGWGNDYIISSPAGGGASWQSWYGGPSWEVPENYFRQSSVYHVKGVTTATMFVSGDPTKGGVFIGRTDDEYFYTALKGQGIPSELLEYEGDGHNMSQSGNARDLLERSESWLDQYLMPASKQ